jgi:hypothetical protein
LKTRIYFGLLILLCFSVQTKAQSIVLNYKGEPLNEILLDLNDQYGIQISVNASLANDCLITINKEFTTMDMALKALADQCKLIMEKIGKVYTFRTREAEKSLIEEDKAMNKAPNPVLYLYQGIIVELRTEEPLPFTSLKLSNQSLISDESGRFAFKSTAVKESVEFRSLGFDIVEAELSPGNNLVVTLTPKSVELNTIEVVGRRDEFSVTNVGAKAGYMQFNDINNSLMPGLSNNLIFNNLRLYPGIMAAGESIADFVIWGSYAGQNHVTYDGISLFNSWGINDDMGRVNPYMVKNVEVYKGGYSAAYGDRIGGVVLIDGKTGNPNQIDARASLTNQLGSAYLNVPMFNKTSTLQIAGRKTLFESFNLSSDFSGDTTLIVPKYNYSDLHIKFSTLFKNADRLEISSIISQDEYEGQQNVGKQNNILQDVNVNSEQYGTSVKYIKNWNQGGLSSFIFSQSEYRPELTTNYFLDFNNTGEVRKLRSEIWTNPISEYRAKLTHSFAAIRGNQLQLSGEFINNKTSFQSSDRGRLRDNSSEALSRISLYATDRIVLAPHFAIEAGLKADIPFTGSKVYFQPRLNGRLDLSKRWNVNFGWGVYNQFVSRNSIIDEIDNRSDIWQVADGKKVPVLSSTHNVLGLGYQGKSFEISAQAYYKLSSGFSRYVLNRRGVSEFIEGEAKAQGIDIFAKKQVSRHQFWVSYSLAKVEERFTVRGRTSNYRPAPQNQLHELKAAAVFNFNPFKLSITNVYGSGFDNRTIDRNRNLNNTYLRTDFAAQYQFDLKAFGVETGISLLNIFNNENVRLNQSINVPDGGILNTVGIPFTPTIYVNFRF